VMLPLPVPEKKIIEALSYLEGFVSSLPKS